VPDAAPVPSLGREVPSEILVEQASPPVALPAPEPPAPPSALPGSVPLPVVPDWEAGEAMSVETAPPQNESHVPLESLMRAPRASGRSLEPPLDLRGLREPSSPPVIAPPTALDRWRGRVRLNRRSEAIGPAGPRQGTLSETEAGLRVPLDDSVSLEGGVRVDQREEPGVEAPERKSSPRVGVEVRF